jgi:hypothetical protein
MAAAGGNCGVLGCMRLSVTRMPAQGKVARWIAGASRYT